MNYFTYNNLGRNKTGSVMVVGFTKKPIISVTNPRDDVITDSTHDYYKLAEIGIIKFFTNEWKKPISGWLHNSLEYNYCPILMIQRSPIIKPKKFIFSVSQRNWAKIMAKIFQPKMNSEIPKYWSFMF